MVAAKAAELQLAFAPPRRILEGMRHDELAVDAIMTRTIVALDPHTTLAHAEEEMRRSDIRHLAVVDRRGQLVGMVSSRELLGRGEHETLAEVMIRDNATVGPDTWAREAVDLMIDQKLDVLPVVDAHGRLAGILTATDFLRVASGLLHARAAQSAQPPQR